MGKRGLIALAVLLLAGLVVFFAGRGREAKTPEDGAQQAAKRRAAFDPSRERNYDGVETSASGQVTGADDQKPIEGAVVALEPVGGGDRDSQDERPMAITDASGQWTIEGLSPGKFALSATAAGFLPATKAEVKLGAGQNGGLHLQLTPGGSPLSGTISDITGGTIEGARVRVAPVVGVGGLGKRQGFTTVSAEDGKYSVNVADGRYRVSVSHLDYGPAGRTIEIRAGSRTHDFALTPAGVIEGVVLRRANDEPVPGATVQFVREKQVSMPGGHRMRMPAQTGRVEADAQGNFRIRGIQPGVVALRGIAHGLMTNEAIEVPVGMAEQITGVKVMVDAAHGVRGRVVYRDDETRGVAGAEVSVMTGGMGIRGATTGPEGDFEILAVLQGRYNLMATGDAFLPQFPGTSVDVDGDVEDVLIVVERGVTIRGRVEPATQAEVSIDIRPEKLMGGGLGGLGGGGKILTLSAAGSVATDEDGNFELGPVSPGALDLIARAADGRVGELAVDVPEAGMDDAVITLDSRARVAGRVIDARGEPVADAVVSMKTRQTGSARMSIRINGMDMGSSSAPTSVEGDFEVVGLADGDYELTVADVRGGTLAWAPAAGIEAGKPMAVTVAGGHDRRGLSLTVEARNGIIRGTVRTAEGQPAPDVWLTATLVPEAPAARPAAAGEEEDDGVTSKSVMVFATSDGDPDGGGMGGSEPPVLTDDAGAFAIKGLREGTYELVAEASGGGARVTKPGVKPGANVAIALAPLGTLVGKVTSGGQPMRDYTVTLTGPNSRSQRVRDGSGEFEITRLDPGRYDVTIKARTGGKTVGATLVAGETTEIDVAVDKWATVTGTVVDKQGKPIPGARVLLGEGDGNSVSLELDGTEEDIRTDDGGKFTTHCAAGPRVLLVMSPDGPAPLVVHPFIANDGETKDLGQLVESPPRGEMMTMDEDVDDPEG